MKILVVCQYYYPEQFYVTDVCEALVRSGHEVTVLTGLPNYPSGIITEEYRHGKRREEWRRGVHIVRCFEIGRKKGAIGLALNYLSFLLSSAYRARRMNIDADILFCYQLSPALMAYPAVLLKRRHRCPLLLYCLDLWPESMKTLLHSENSPLFRVVKRFCTMLYQACDHIAVPSEAFVEYMQTVHGIVGKRLSVLPQFAPDALLNEKLECDNGVTDFVFLGNIGTAQDMPCLLVTHAIGLLRGGLRTVRFGSTGGFACWRPCPGCSICQTGSSILLAAVQCSLRRNAVRKSLGFRNTSCSTADVLRPICPRFTAWLTLAC